jgi:hypothetical protein
LTNVRFAFSALIVALLFMGYAASQVAAFAGTADRYAQAVDRPVIAYLATLVLIFAFILAFVRREEAE